MDISYPVAGGVKAMIIKMKVIKMQAAKARIFSAFNSHYSIPFNVNLKFILATPEIVIFIIENLFINVLLNSELSFFFVG